MRDQGPRVDKHMLQQWYSQAISLQARSSTWR